MAEYYIAFDTKEIPGCIVATTVEIKQEIIRDDKLKMAINLVDDPLYRKLARYIKSNPSRN